MTEKKLTPRQQRFVEEYVGCLNATKAAIAAEYSEDTAYSIGQRLLKNVEVAAAIAKEQESLSKRTEVSQEWVIQNLKRIASRCMQAEPVVDRNGAHVLAENDDGEMVPCYTFNASGATRAVELIGRHIGMFTEKVDLTSKGESIAPQMDNKEMARRMAMMLHEAASNDKR